mmetsp:Transcript_33720/g.101819  ORF Transcript_33720/g.101819 Transcript_33720/m.101819 type:complete len:270 (-) Transcript_33720:1772-2581(-)
MARDVLDDPRLPVDFRHHVPVGGDDHDMASTLHGQAKAERREHDARCREYQSGQLQPGGHDLGDAAAQGVACEDHFRLPPADLLKDALLEGVDRPFQILPEVALAAAPRARPAHDVLHELFGQQGQDRNHLGERLEHLDGGEQLRVGVDVPPRRRPLDGEDARALPARPAWWEVEGHPPRERVVRTARLHERRRPAQLGEAGAEELGHDRAVRLVSDPSKGRDVERRESRIAAAPAHAAYRVRRLRRRVPQPHARQAAPALLPSSPMDG